MPSLEAAIMTHASLVLDVFALDAATINGDFDEARFLASSVASAATRFKLWDVARAANQLALVLNATSTLDHPTVYAELTHLNAALDAADPDPEHSARL